MGEGWGSHGTCHFLSVDIKKVVIFREHEGHQLPPVFILAHAGKTYCQTVLVPTPTQPHSSLSGTPICASRPLQSFCNCLLFTVNLWRRQLPCNYTLTHWHLTARRSLTGLLVSAWIVYPTGQRYWSILHASEHTLVGSSDNTYQGSGQI